MRLLASFLSSLRRLLVQKAQVPVDSAWNYSLHSLKATGLSWALQLDVDSVGRRFWGHHRCREPGEVMVARYSRDDVLPVLRAQLQVLRAIRRAYVGDGFL